MLKTEIRQGAYFDSVVLMQLQRVLAELPDVQDAGVVMGVQANKDLLAQGDLLSSEAAAASPDDLVIVVRGESASAAEAALQQVDELLARRSQEGGQGDYRPKSLESAVSLAPDARWVMISVPGRYAAAVAREALRLDKNVFLYSDNVAVEDEVTLKQAAAEQGLLVMGPDCGTAIVNGVGLGFANRVRRGPIGIVAASGTGLQLVSSRIHQLGRGISHGLGTGGRDMSEAVGGMTTHQSLTLLARDPETKVIVLLSKPPAESIARKILRFAGSIGKPVVVNFIGYRESGQSSWGENIYFANSLDAAAELAVTLVEDGGDSVGSVGGDSENEREFAPGQRYLRGLFSGGTLAYEALLQLQRYLPVIYSNVALDPVYKLAPGGVSREHTIVDLGDDEFTVGRLHPMLDNDLRVRRLQEEASDPETAVILVDVVLGDGAHPDPASELAPAIKEARVSVQQQGRDLVVVVVVVGTDEDPQDLDGQVETLRAAGATVLLRNEDGVRRAGEVARSLANRRQESDSLAALQEPLVAINVGLESFAKSLHAQEALVIPVDWRPPAGGNERLMGILARMKNAKQTEGV